MACAVRSWKCNILCVTVAGIAAGWLKGAKLSELVTQLDQFLRRLKVEHFVAILAVDRIGRALCKRAASVAGMHPYWMHTNTKYAPSQCTLKDASITNLMDDQKAPTTQIRTCDVQKQHQEVIQLSYEGITRVGSGGNMTLALCTLF